MGARKMCNEWLTKIIEEATARVGEEYFHLKIDGGDSIYRERVYCYELYHKMRCWWPTNTPFLVQGEVSKSGHPKFPPKLRKTPDFLIHTPGDMEGNHTIIEAKSPQINKNGSVRKNTKGIRKDLNTLSRFKSEVGYQRAIYLVYGYEAAGFADHVKEIADQFQKSEPIELWLHEEPGKPAACHTTLQRPNTSGG